MKETTKEIKNKNKTDLLDYMATFLMEDSKVEDKEKAEDYAISAFTAMQHWLKDKEAAEAKANGEEAGFTATLVYSTAMKGFKVLDSGGTQVGLLKKSTIIDMLSAQVDIIKDGTIFKDIDLGNLNEAVGSINNVRS